jgi:hypothetical protein
MIKQKKLDKTFSFDKLGERKKRKVMIVIESLNHINLPAHNLEKSEEFYS